MMQAFFDGADLPPRGRLAALNELFTASGHPMGVRSQEADDYWAAARTVDLAAVNVVELAIAPSQVTRTARMVAQADPEVLSVAVASTGKLVMSQAGREAVLGTWDVALYDSSRPFDLHLGAGGERATVLRAHIPKALLGQPEGRIERLLARPLPGQGGFAGMLVHFLRSLTAGSAAYRPDDTARLAGIASDLFTAFVAHHLDADSRFAADTGFAEEPRKRALLLSIEAYVEQHLHDPDLSPGAIAGAHHLSVGYLHRLFSARETTVAAWIRGRRLERAGRDLRDTAQHDVPVHRIAARWGFKDHSTFTRTFRAAYGVSPRDYRHSARSSVPLG
jgi:AraC-like DNA-binding protein